MKKFISYVMENERNAFLGAHFDDPGSNSVLLIFADWLEERGDALAPVIRHMMSGHEAGQDMDWSRRSTQPMLALFERIRNKVAPGEWPSYNFRYNRKLYRVNNTGIELRTRRGWEQVPQEMWDDNIVNGALFIILRQLAESPPSRDRGFHDEYPNARSAGGSERFVQQALIRFLHSLNEIASQLWGRRYTGQGAARNAAADFAHEAQQMITIVQRYGITEQHQHLVERIRSLVNETARHLVSIEYAAQNYAESPAQTRAAMRFVQSISDTLRQVGRLLHLQIAPEENLD